MDDEEVIVARLICDALRQTDPSALFLGEPDAPAEENSVLIDGSFNMISVARLLLAEMEERGLLRR